MAVNWQCFAISLAFHICYDIHAPSSATVLLSNFHIFLLSHFGIRGGIIFYKKELQFWEVIHIPTLVLYVDHCLPPRNKNMGEVYKMLTSQGEKTLDSYFQPLDNTHPAKAPYALFQQAL